jgi:hypothetical protein
MNMWPSDNKPTLDQIPKAKIKIPFDKFHGAKYLRSPIDQVRKQELKDL